MAFSSYCRQVVNRSSSLITSRISSSQIRSKHSISRAQSVSISTERPLRQFVTGKDKSAGRNSKGRITIWHRGGGAKRSQRTIDLKRNTSSIGVVERIEYDPNRTSRIAVVRWVEGAAVDRPKKVNSVENLSPSNKTLPSMTLKGQFSFSSLPGMLEEKKMESLSPKKDHVIVGLPKGSMTLTSQSQSQNQNQNQTQMRNVKDVILSAFSSNVKRHNSPYSFVNSLGVPRMAVAGAKPEFFVPRVKDDLKENESLLLNEVKRWDKDSEVWGHKMKRKAAVSWGSLRERAILGLVGIGDVDEKSKLKSKEREMGKGKKDGTFGVDRAPVSYILATHQMEAGKMVMNCDLTKKSNDELLHRY